VSWAIAGYWLAVAGLILLTFGTGAQAGANLAEFKSLQASVSKVASDVIAETVAETVGGVVGAVIPLFPGSSSSGLSIVRMFVRLLRLMLARRSILSAVILMPRKLAQLRAKGGDEAVQMARFIRLAEVWAILMVGSALALVAAVIQLALAYQ
jgi:hypothetical protein